MYSKSNERWMVSTITAETKREGQRQAKRCTTCREKKRKKREES
jgi:hypothetical protein